MEKEKVIHRSQDEIEDDMIDLIDEYINEVYEGEIGEDGEEFDLTYDNGNNIYQITITIDEQNKQISNEMTQEEKELMFKDLCAKLPYGVI